MTTVETPLGFESPGVAVSHVVTETARTDRATVAGAEPIPWRTGERLIDPVMVEVRRTRCSHDRAGSWHVEDVEVSGYLSGGIEGTQATQRFSCTNREDWPAWLDELVDYLTGVGGDAR